jgi:hypothetical protein
MQAKIRNGMVEKVSFFDSLSSYLEFLFGKRFLRGSTNYPELKGKNLYLDMEVANTSRTFFARSSGAKGF